MRRDTTRGRFRLNTRASGVLLHPTSLPGPGGCGDLGAAAYEFVDFLAAAGQTWWQMLPSGPAGKGNSPYSTLSAFAGSPLLISLDRLVGDGLLERSDLKPRPRGPAERVDFPVVRRYHDERLHRAFWTFAREGGFDGPEFMRFFREESHWLPDYALYMALRSTQGATWTRWPAGIRARQSHALDGVIEVVSDFVAYECFVQFQFQRQWLALKQYANEHGVGLIGDIPIFVAHDSSDVWAHPELFDLDTRGHAKTISGVPPDMFSRTGQLWNHPQYRWPRHADTGFAWWVARFARTFAQFDAVRIDHFLGFHRVWAVPGRARTAQHGKWVKTPGAKLFATLRKKLGRLEIIAEDLGVVTREAVALRERCGFPGMRLLHFAFGSDEGSRYNQPHMFPHDCVVYPGTHDNETTVGWFESLRRARSAEARRIAALARAAARGAKAKRRTGAAPPRYRPLTTYDRVRRYLGTAGREIHWDMIRLVLQSPADTAIVPVQDVLGLDNTARMNTPATARGNWEWRLKPGQLTARHAARLRELVEAYGRLPPGTTTGQPG